MKKRVKTIVSTIALFSAELLTVWGIFILSMIVFFVISEEIFLSREEAFDYKVFLWIDLFATERLTHVMKNITFFASREFIVSASIGIFLFFLFIRKHKWYSLKIPVVALGSCSLNIITKSLFDRPRPLLAHLVEASGWSFPSGHAMISSSFYGLLIYLIWREVKSREWKILLTMLLLIAISLIGFSRIYLRVHFASDVLAGFALGFIWLILSVFILRKLEHFSVRKFQKLKKE